MYAFRCFESGIFCGFFQSHGDSLFRSITEEHKITALVYEHVYNDWDVNATHFEGKGLLVTMIELHVIYKFGS